MDEIKIELSEKTEKVEILPIHVANVDKELSSLNFEDEKALDIFRLRLSKALEPYDIPRASGVPALLEAKEVVTTLKNKVDKYFKTKRDSYNAISKSIKATGDKACEEATKLKERLIADMEALEALEKKALLRAKLPMRQALLEKEGLVIDDEYIVQLDDATFIEVVEDKKLAIKQAKEAEEAKIKAVKELGESRYSLIEELGLVNFCSNPKEQIILKTGSISEEEFKNALETLKAKKAEAEAEDLAKRLANEKLEAWLAANGYDEAKDKLVHTDSGVELWILKGVYDNGN